MPQAVQIAITYSYSYRCFKLQIFTLKYLDFLKTVLSNNKQ